VNIIEFLDPIFLINTLGLAGVLVIIFAESGLFFGFFLPGDSLLFSAGVLAAAGYFDMRYLVLGAAAAAILGDSVGYVFGARVGPKIFSREDSRFFKKSHLEKTANFYLKYGKKTIVLARFIPIVRTFAPILAGVGRMPYRLFLTYNVLGGILWGAGLTFLGYFLGKSISGVDRYLWPLIAVIILTSFLPALKEFLNRASSRYTD
jgi:membrane-associated protein